MYTYVGHDSVHPHVCYRFQSLNIYDLKGECVRLIEAENDEVSFDFFF